MLPSRSQLLPALAALSLILPPTSGSAQVRDRETPGSELLYRSKLALYPADAHEASRWAPLAPSPLDSIDVTDIDLDLEIFPSTGSISGAATLRIAALRGPLSSFDLDLVDLSVDSVRVGSSAGPSAYDGQHLQVVLASPVSAGDTIETTVHYHGVPSGGLYFSSWNVYNLSEPTLARNWFPCHDVPWDRATSSVSVTLPDPWEAVSNGLSLGTTVPETGKTTYRWATAHTLPSYLISVNAADYSTVEDTHNGIPLTFYVRPLDLERAESDFLNLPAMMEAFEDLFGPYPFADEKYAVCEASDLGGAMENNTCTSYGASLVTGDNAYDWVQAHELAHHWWGNLVTVEDWPEIWLNEGFATYSDALYHEYRYGRPSYRSRMGTFKSTYFNYDTGDRFPMYDPSPLFSPTVYEKGAWVLHMLRSVMGDSAFFEGLGGYRAAHAHGNASTEDLRSALESVHGEDLSWFFNPWVYGQGYPHYVSSWNLLPTSHQYIVWLKVRQIQTNAPIFAMPLEVRIQTAVGDTTLTVWNDQAVQSYSIPLADYPVQVTLDPDEKILRKTSTEPVTAAGAPGASFLLEQNVPNPFNPTTVIRFHAEGPTPVDLRVFDVSGRHVATLFRGTVDGTRRVIWDGTDDAGREVASGLYLYRLQAGDRALTRKMLLAR
jgi:aminopeptidase N